MRKGPLSGRNIFSNLPQDKAISEFSNALLVQKTDFPIKD